MNIYLYIYLSYSYKHLSIYLAIYQSIYILSIYKHLSIYLSTIYLCLFILSIAIPSYLTIIYLIYNVLSVHLTTIHISINLKIYLSIYLSIFLYFYLSNSSDVPRVYELARNYIYPVSNLTSHHHSFFVQFLTIELYIYISTSWSAWRCSGSYYYSLVIVIFFS